jgi:glycosyltransferase involved in cell wall biosynthesis
MQPLVSILIPAYNAEKWMADTIKSALGQDWARKELVIVDDGSTDQTLAVAKQFAGPSVCVVSQPNQGAASARNKALSLCQGEYIQWLDADDLLAPDKISRQLEASDQSGTDHCVFSGPWAYFMCRPSKASWLPTPLACDLSPVEWMLCKMEQGAFMQTTVWLVSRKLTEAAGPWDNRLTLDDDGEYFSRVILASQGVRFIPQARSFYRISGTNSLSYVGLGRGKLDSQLLSLELQISHLRAVDDSPRVRTASLNYLQRNLICFHPDRPDLVARARDLAVALGGQLAAPALAWKYAWLQKLFGWQFAKRTQVRYNRAKLLLARSLDQALAQLEGQQQKCRL